MVPRSLTEGSDMHYVFSYGSLKDKFSLSAKRATLEGNFEMDYYGVFPMIRLCKELNPLKVDGYLLELNDSQFTEADRYEGYPDLYDRKEMKVVSDGQIVSAWVYVQGNPTE